MDNKLDNDYIKDVIDELVKVVGIKENVPFTDFSDLLRSKKIEDAVQLAATCLKLPIKIQLSFVSDKYDPQEKAEFQSNSLTNISRERKGIGGITAQVYIPTYLPPYGSSALNNLPIKVKVSKDCAKNPYSFIAVISHELSHILLATLNYKHKNNEIYTDLTPMMLGFSDIINEGRTVMEEYTEHNPIITSKDKNGIGTGHIESHRYKNIITYGYLTNQQFDYAKDKISLLYKKFVSLKDKFIEEYDTYKKLIKSYERKHFVFNKYLEYVDNHFNQKINKKDGSFLIDLHQQSYKDKFVHNINNNKEKLSYFEGKIDNLSNSTLFPENIEKVNNELKEAKLNIKSEIKVINDSLKILKKYVSVKHRLRIYFNMI